MMESGPWRLASEADGLGEARGMPKNMRVQNRRVDGLDSLACLQKDVAAQLVEENEGGLDHALRAAEFEFDRIATIEVANLVRHQRQNRMTQWLQKQALVCKPMPSMSISEVGAREKQNALAVHVPPCVDRIAAMKHFDEVSRKELLVLKQSLSAQMEATIHLIRSEQREMAKLELEGLFREHKVERELLSRDINQAYVKMFNEAVMEFGFSEQVLLINSKKFQDPMVAEQMRANLNAERDQRMMRALREMDARHAEMIALTKSEAKKRAKVAEDKRRGELQANATQVVGQKKCNIASEREKKLRELRAREEETAALEKSIKVLRLLALLASKYSVYLLY
jgi:hypothetical protein